MAEITREKKPLKSLVPAPAAGIISLIVPGLGQVLGGKVQRGLILLGSFISIIGLLGWRIHTLAHREPDAWAKFVKALDRRPVFILVVLLFIVFLWLWNARDAYKQVKEKKRGNPIVFVIILAAFFTLGLQISQVDIVKMFVELPDAWPPLSRVLWPWEAAITHETDEIGASAEILIGCDNTPPAIPVEVEGEPYIMADPTCGELSTLDENNKVIKGSTITLTGRGFAPDTETLIFWQDSLGNEFRPRQDGKYVSVMTDSKGEFIFYLVMPYRLIPPSARGDQIHQVSARQVTETGVISASDPLKLTIGRMIETIFMGMMATFFGIIFSIPISFLAARNLMSGSWLTMTIYFVTRTILNIVRSIEPLIWALIAVVWVGLGPFAGIIALTLHSVAALGKLYSEAIESIDPGPIEAIQATGANKLQTIMFAVVPQMIPPFVSFSIYRWDINVRMSTVIGLVGGGGIGFLLVQYIRLLDYKAAGIAVWFIAITVAILDYVSSEIRNRFV